MSSSTSGPACQWRTQTTLIVFPAFTPTPTPSSAVTLSSLFLLDPLPSLSPFPAGKEPATSLRPSVWLAFTPLSSHLFLRLFLLSPAWVRSKEAGTCWWPLRSLPELGPRCPAPVLPGSACSGVGTHERYWVGFAYSGVTRNPMFWWQVPCLHSVVGRQHSGFSGGDSSPD